MIDARKRILILYPIAGGLLFCTQIALHFFGRELVGKVYSPFLLFLVFILIAIVYTRLYRHDRIHDNDVRERPGHWFRIAGICVGLAGILVMYEELRKLFVSIDPAVFSDVIMQVQTLYERWASGEFPYQIIILPSHHLYPIYFPMHWLPVGITAGSNLDVRWSGFVVMVFAGGVSGYLYSGLKKTHWLKLVLAVLLPTLALWGYICFDPREIAVSYELVVAAYYLILGTALYTRNVFWVIVAIIFCLLSRFTLIFWLPLFVVMMFRVLGIFRATLAVVIIGLSVLFLYVVPFFAKDPKILVEGLRYYQNASIGEWNGYGDPPVSWTLEKGTYFAGTIKSIIGGTIEEKVDTARMIQGIIMLVLCATGIGVFLLNHAKRMHWMRYGLLFLYLILGCFFFFSPLTFSYYFLSFYMISAVLCGAIMCATPEIKPLHELTPS